MKAISEGGPGGRRAAKDGLSARDQIQRTAIRMFAQQGYVAVATKQLAAETGLTIGALYHHFPSKESLYEAAIHQVVGDIPDAPVLDPDPDPRAALEQLVEWYAVAISTDTETASLLRREFTDPRLTSPITDFPVFARALVTFQALLAKAAPGADARLVEGAITSLLFGVVGLPGLRRILPGTIFSGGEPAQLAKSICAIVLDGVAR